MNWILCVVALLVGLYALTRIRTTLKAATAVFVGGLLLLTLVGLVPDALAWVLWPVAVLLVLMNVGNLRRRYLSTPVLHYIRRVLPPISDTEREAIEAGTVWWESELFRGNPDWSKLLQVPAPGLNEEEQAYMDGPVERLCEMLDDWEITHELNDLPDTVWEFMARQRFWAINIPKEYGGLEFSAEANSAIVMKVCSRSGTAGVTVMVPNSLGPAELLLHYGTERQKNYYLPRLANGEEIPCFGLTNPVAGSDAGAIPDHGVICEGIFEGEKVLGLRLNWEKRYITLGPVATLLGLAFKAYDPDHIIGDREDLGITCALIPTNTPGVTIGNRHLPLNAAFQNGPNRGENVFIPMDWLIGGDEWLGKGWRMLMESLAAGRGISLPASGVAAAKMAARTAGAYARIREQFGLPIGKFEGVEEALARIAGTTYTMDAARLLTVSALKLGEKPSVISAIVKYELTEGARRVVGDAMDVHGGRGICMGPSNYLARGYQQIPIAITVEGANILTRSMIIFGQGAMRCHPYLLEEIRAASDTEPGAEERFDSTLTGHLGYTSVNAARAFVFGLSSGHLAPAPVGRGSMARYYRDFARYSAAFALLSDATLLLLGGALKRREKLSGRFADVLSNLYLGTAVLKHHEDTKRPQSDFALVEWSCQTCLYNIQLAFDAVLRNFPVKSLAVLLRWVIFPLGRRHRCPRDELGHRVAQVLLAPSDSRDRLTEGIYVNEDPNDITGCLEDALPKVIDAEPLRRRLKKEGHAQPPRFEHGTWMGMLVRDGVITEQERTVLDSAHSAASKVIAVDDFEPATTGTRVSTEAVA